VVEIVLITNQIACNGAMAKVFAFIVFMLGFCVLPKRSDGACDLCEKRLNEFCCVRPLKIYEKDPQKKICCAFPEHVTECAKEGQVCHSDIGVSTECCSGLKCGIDANPYFRTCFKKCRNDRDCKGVERCLGGGCIKNGTPMTLPPPVGPTDPDPGTCPENSECSADSHCQPFPLGETCMCASCECACEKTQGKCDETSACKSNDDCKLNKNGTVIPGRENFGCIDCACERTMTGNCLEGECSKDEDCAVEGGQFKAYCDTTSCQCFLELDVDYYGEMRALN